MIPLAALRHRRHLLQTGSYGLQLEKLIAVPHQSNTRTPFPRSTGKNVVRKSISLSSLLPVERHVY